MRRSSSRVLAVRFLLALIMMAAVAFPTAARAPIRKTRAATARPVNYPKIRAAISSLEAARAELQRTDGDFGGHKKDAVDAIDNALKQMRLALQFEKY
jgi:hypothetical protein